MKTRILLLMATALFAVLGFTACSDSSDMESATPGSDQLGEPIKAQFTISIPMGSTTRMSAATVQNGEDISSFRGIDFISLWPSSDAIIGASSTLGNKISLTQILRPEQLTVNNYIPSGKLVTNNKSVLYGDVMINEGTQSFLFYGKAIDNTADVKITEAADKFKFGMLNATTTASTATNPSAFTFSPVPIVANTSDGADKRSSIVTYLNSIAQAKYTDTADHPWSSETNAVLAALYTNFITMKAGSSANLQAAINDLYNGLKENAHTVATAVVAAINNSDYVTITTDATTNVSTVTFNDNIAGYPGDINLPDGSAVLTYDATSREFSYVATNISYPGSTPEASSMNVANIGSFVYPANLYYWVNSPIKVSNSSQAANYNGEKSWSEILGGYDATATAITRNTRSVALVNPVQYGVGRLDIKVVADKTAWADNGAGKEEGESAVALANVKLTGILIGKQKPVDWKFEPTGDTEYTIYDNIVVSQGRTDGGITIGQTATSYQNHTLVLETAGSEDESVNVALEFVNNGKTFWGKDGRVPTGTKFYLLGKLDMSEATDATKANTGNKVFKQDYITSATFTISSMKNALNTIPDLRNPRIELGLSVDLQWKAGVTFNHTIQ